MFKNLANISNIRKIYLYQSKYIRVKNILTDHLKTFLEKLFEIAKIIIFQ